MQLSLGHAFDGADGLAAIGLGAQHQAGAGEAPVDGDAAGAAVTGAAAFLRTGQAQRLRNTSSKVSSASQTYSRYRR